MNEKFVVVPIFMLLIAFFWYRCCRELYSNNLTGTLPAELGNISALISLDLYQNNFIGPIPDSLGDLTNLRFLYVLFLKLNTLYY